MALSITSNYAGEVADGIIAKLVTGNEVFENGLAYLTTAKKTLNVPKISSDDLVQDYAATPSSSGTLTITEATLSPQKFNIYTEFNPMDFDDFWRPATGDSPLVFKRLAPELQVELVSEVLRNNATWWGRNLWQGDTAGSAPNNKFNGFKKVMNGDATVIDVATPVTLTAANIEGELDRLRAVTPAAVWNHPDFSIVGSHATGQLYGEAQKDQTNKGVDFTMAGVNLYWGKRCYFLSGMPDDVLIAGVMNNTRSSNFWVGVEAVGDGDLVKVEPLQANSDLYFIKMTMKAATQIIWGAETVGYNV